MQTQKTEAVPGVRFPTGPAIMAVIEEMRAVATSEHDGVMDEWTAENRADIDKWQCRLADAISAPAGTEVLAAAAGLQVAPRKGVLGMSVAQIELAEWRAVLRSLQQAQDYLQKDGERHTWLDGALGIAKERSEGKGVYASQAESHAKDAEPREDRK